MSPLHRQTDRIISTELVHTYIIPSPVHQLLSFQGASDQVGGDIYPSYHPKDMLVLCPHLRMQKKIAGSPDVIPQKQP